MYVPKALVAGMQRLAVRCFLKGPGSSVLLAGTLALTGIGAAALTHPAGGSVQLDRPAGATSNLPVSYGCFNDPDGDGTIKCGSSVSIATLPAAWGQCRVDLYGDGFTVCDGTAQ
jgi:hypothetical protein